MGHLQSTRCTQQPSRQMLLGTELCPCLDRSAASSPGPGQGGQGTAQVTHHCCELVELGPQVGTPEVDVGGFIPHLVTVRTEAEGPVRSVAGPMGTRAGEGVGKIPKEARWQSLREEGETDGQNPWEILIKREGQRGLRLGEGESHGCRRPGRHKGQANRKGRNPGERIPHPHPPLCPLGRLG